MTRGIGLWTVSLQILQSRSFADLFRMSGQILCDIVQSNGIVGGPYVDPKTNKNPVKLVFCNPDLLWKSDFPRPRIGQGGFKVAFQGVYEVCLLVHKAGPTISIEVSLDSNRNTVSPRAVR
jgi:hypothetical protein